MHCNDSAEEASVLCLCSDVCSHFMVHFMVSSCSIFQDRKKVLHFFSDADYFFLEVVFFFPKKTIRTKKNILRKKTFRAKKSTQTFFSVRGVFFFLARMPQILEVVKKVLWAIPWAPVGEHGVCGDL